MKSGALQATWCSARACSFWWRKVTSQSPLRRLRWFPCLLRQRVRGFLAKCPSSGGHATFNASITVSKGEPVTSKLFAEVSVISVQGLRPQTPRELCISVLTRQKAEVLFGSTLGCVVHPAQVKAGEVLTLTAHISERRDQLHFTLKRGPPAPKPKARGRAR